MILGFTSLNEKMAERGYYGLELVAKHLNEYFGNLIEILDQNGGDLYKIAGDACIVSFCKGTQVTLAGGVWELLGEEFHVRAV